MTPEYVEILETLQRRAFTEGRDHLVATVEWAFPGVAPEMADRLIPRASAAPAEAIEEEDRSDCANPVRGEGGKFEGCAPGEGGGSDGGNGGSPFDHKPPPREKNPFDHKPPPREKNPFDHKPPTRKSVAEKPAEAKSPLSEKPSPFDFKPPPTQKRGKDWPSYDRVLTDPKEIEIASTFNKEKKRLMMMSPAEREAFRPELERVAVMTPEQRHRDPAYRARNGLPPLAATKKRKEDAEEREDCEKPIRDEDGKFLGCEAGGGSGGGGSGSGGGGGGGGSSESSDPFAVKPPPRAKLSTPKAPSSEHAAPAAKPTLTKKQQDDIDERVHLIKLRSPNMSDEELASARASLEGNILEKEERIARLQGSGAIKPLPTGNRDEALKARSDLDDYAKKAHAEIFDLQKKAAAQISDLRNLNTLDDEPIVASIGEDAGEIDTFADAHSSLRAFTGEGEDVDFNSLGSDENRALYSPDDSLDDDEMTPEQIRQRDSDLEKIKARKGEVKKAAAEAHATFSALHEKQVSAIADLKAKIKATKAAAKTAAKDIDNIDPEDLVSDELRKSYEKASEVIDSDDSSDEDIAAAESVIAEYETARDTAEEIRDRESEAIGEPLTDKLDELEDSLRSMRESAKATKSLTGKLGRAAGIRASAKTTTKKATAKKTKAAESDNDETDDDAEDDEE